MLAAVVTLLGLGVLFGVGLYYASRIFHVDVDPRIQQVLDALPGANCGACGQPGCGGFARAVVHGSADLAGCAVGGCDVARRIGAILGKEVGETVRRVAVLHCAGRDVKDRFRYDGPRDCVAAALIRGGPKACAYGCIGYGTCARACPFGAISMVDGLPVVDEEKCTACGICVAACPKGLFELHAVTHHVHVRCRSREKGAVVRKVCSVGCIGCKKCEKTCPHDAIHVAENLASIDYGKCTSCAACVKVCPMKTIEDLRPAREARARGEDPRAACAAASTGEASPSGGEGA
ncbi:MAG: RnfABCDGE type electron transport complex subunit B [Planctomycetes bacterium]|nr:RnfABCDGE type electron transport complex subunit B [Planctomycetota bacterium]